jgi:hypothetical protein
LQRRRPPHEKKARKKDHGEERGEEGKFSSCVDLEFKRKRA